MADEEIRRGNFLLSFRFFMAILLCFALTTSQIMRGNLSMAIICMVNQSTLNNLNQFAAEMTPIVPSFRSNDIRAIHHFSSNDSAIHLSSREEFHWNQWDIAHLFAALYVGLIVAAIPMGYLADRLNPKWLLMASVIISTITTELTPGAARFNYWVLVGVRIGMGLAQASVYSCIGAITSQWCPRSERSTFIGITTSGSQLSYLLAMPMSAALCVHGFDGGWPSIFYASGLYGVVWSALWLVFASRNPAKNRFISVNERDYIQQNTNVARASLPNKCSTYKRLLSSLPVWILILNYAAFSVAMNVMRMYLPLYWQQMMHLDIASNGFYSALPNLLQLISKYFSSFGADKLKTGQHWFSPTSVCKLFNSACLLGLGWSLYALTFMDSQHQGLAIAFICVAFAMSGASGPGFLTSMVTIAPNHSGSIASFCIFISTLLTVPFPYVMAEMSKNGTRAAWESIFYTTSVTTVIAGLLFILFGSAEEQPWAVAEGDEEPIVNSNPSEIEDDR